MRLWLQALSPLVVGLVGIFTLWFVAKKHLLDQRSLALLDDQLAIAKVQSETAKHQCDTAIRQLTLAQRKEEEQWHTIYRDIHAQFWADESMRDLRRWISHTASYELELRPALMARFHAEEHPFEFTAEEYRCLEVVDTFCSMIMRLIDAGEWSDAVSSPETTSAFIGLRQTQLQISFHDYWIRTIQQARPELWAYLEKFWPRLAQQYFPKSANP